MKVRPIDILALHLNAGRIEGNEQIYFSSILSNRSHILKSIDILVKADLLKLENSIEISLPKLTKPDLESILKKANLKKSGNKPVLIKRIIENIDYINSQNINIDLPTVYTPTTKGQELIEETGYIKHFGEPSSIISMERAQSIINNSTEKNIVDKIEYIYLFEIKRLYKDKPIPKTHLNISNNISYYFHNLADYYIAIQEYEKARKYYHLTGFISTIFYDLEILKDNHSHFYDYEGNFKVFSPTLHAYGILDVYEQLIYVHELSNEEIYELFLHDVSEYYKPDEEYSKFYIYGTILKALKENTDELSFNFKNYIETNYPYEKSKYETLYDHKDYDTTLATNLKTLLDNDVNINVEIVKETGEVYMYISQSERERIFESELIDYITNKEQNSEDN
ncbi:SAP domain-containing protein [Mammaliicoccus sciuri]|uniref:SAP domain-containing protein n=1 Tax=Mammaliicoccus sciuri TaxID=1296 RepID=UPI002885CF3B|nr:SAP domain-containing protein [Mammaliicoccus sciuri]MDT0704060.1 SAP domain-containing protein [Mammaliicoccus sciuri]